MSSTGNTVTGVMFAIMVRELLAGPCTALELADETGLRHETVLRYLRCMRSQRVAYIDSWAPDSAGRVTTAAYRIGLNKPDAKRQPMPRAEIKRRYYRRAQQRAIHQAIQGVQP